MANQTNLPDPETTTESSEWCDFTFDGTDTDGTEWNMCTVHNELVMGDAYVCEGYHAPEYQGV